MGSTPVDIHGALVAFDPLILTGADGGPGEPGAKGDPGITPQLSIGTVSSVPSGQTASASITGTASDPVLNLILVDGPAGSGGGGTAVVPWEPSTAYTEGQLVSHTGDGVDGIDDLFIVKDDYTSSGSFTTDYDNEDLRFIGGQLQALTGSDGTIVIGGGIEIADITVGDLSAVWLPKAGTSAGANPGSMTGDIDMGTNKVTDLGTPTDPDDAATKGYVDAATSGSGSGNVSKASNSAHVGAIQVSAGTDKTVADLVPSGAGIVKVDANGVAAIATGSDIPNIAESQVTSLTTDLAAKAPLASPTFTGTPAAPTPTANDNSTKVATTAYVDTADALRLSKTGGTMSGAIAMGTNKITGLTNGSSSADAVAFGQLSTFAPLASPTFTGTVTVPTTVNSTDAASKAYVDATAQGLAIKPSVRVATTGAETFTILSGSVTAVTGTTIDGVSVSVNDRVLVKDAPASTGAGSANSTQPGNGIYSVVSNVTNLVLTRVSDMSGTNAPAGAFAFTEAGTANAGAGYVVTTPSSGAAFTYGTNNIAWTQFSGAGEVTAGAGLAKSGNTLAVENSGVLTVAHGGTGAATLTGVIKGNGTGAMTAATAGTDYFAPSTVTTKGDLLAATASATIARLAVGSNTQVLTADSTQTTGMKWAAAGGGGSAPVIAGSFVGAFYTSIADNDGTWQVGTGDLNLLYCLPCWLSPGTVGSLVQQCTGSATSGETLAVGIYADNGRGYPGALATANNLSVSLSTTGVKTVGSLGLVISTAALYWLATCRQGSTNTSQVLCYQNNLGGSRLIVPSMVSGGSNLYDSNHAWTQASVTSTLPSTFSGTTGSASASNGFTPSLWYSYSA